MHALRSRLARVSLFVLAFTASAAAQAPVVPPLKPVPPLPPIPASWDGNAAIGMSLNRGNSSTTNLNLSFDATRDSRTGSLWKFKGLYLRGDTNGVRAVDRLQLDGRHEYTLSPRTYGFGQLQFLQDRFKAIGYLWAPGAGIGYKLIAGGATTLHVDAGLGVTVQKDLTAGAAEHPTAPSVPVRVDGDLTLANTFEHRISKGSSVTQSFNVLCRAQDFGEALYTFSTAVTAAVTAHTKLKMQVLDSYSTRPPEVHVQGNDVAVVTAVVYTF